MQKRGACRFFLWYDPFLPQKTRNVMASLLTELRSIERENVGLKMEISKLNAKMKMACWHVSAAAL